MLLFAKLRDAAGAEAVSIALPAGSTVDDLRKQLTDAYPAVAGLLERSAVAVNHDFADADRPLTAGDEVAIIPPVSGG